MSCLLLLLLSLTITQPTATAAATPHSRPHSLQAHSHSHSLQAPPRSRSSSFNNSDNSNITHILFIGDSLMRYQFLSYVYRIHFETEDVPMDQLIMTTRRFKRSWNAFFRNTTAIFNGAMVCDCDRNNGSPMRENRYYRHPSGLKFVTYVNVMGDNVFRGFHVKNRHIQILPPWEMNLKEFMEERVGLLVPRPSRILINQGHHSHPQIARNISVILRSATEAIVPLNGSCVAWMETTPVKGKLHSLGVSDIHIVRNGICKGTEHIDLKKRHVKVGKIPNHCESTNCSTIIENNLVSSCVYVPMPSLNINGADYCEGGDVLHFANETIYNARVQAAFDACDSL
jgi:hypothetical protein